MFDNIITTSKRKRRDFTSKVSNMYDKNVNAPKRTVLIVDDSYDIRLLMKSHINMFCEEINILEAESGNDAIAKLTSHSINLIISDIDMPDGNGLDLFNFLQESKIEVGFLFFSGSLTTVYSDSKIFLGHVKKNDFPMAIEKINSYLKENLV